MTARGHHGLLLGAGGGPAGYPNLLSITVTAFTTAATSHPANMPGVVAAGDLLMAVVSSDGSLSGSTVATPPGWTAEGSQHQSGGTFRLSVFSVIAAGTEGGTTVNFATTDAEEVIVSIFRVQVGTHGGEVEAAFNNASAGGTSIANPTLTPSWGSATNLWACAISTGGGLSVTSYPLPDNQASHVTPAMGKLAYCTKLQAAASLTPANWALSVALGNAVTATIGIKPA